MWTGPRAVFPHGPGSPGGGYDPVTDTWSCLPSRDAPTSRSRPMVVWTGTQMLLSAGSNDGSNTGALWTR